MARRSKWCFPLGFWQRELMPPKKDAKKKKAKLPTKKSLDATIANAEAAAEERKLVRLAPC